MFSFNIFFGGAKMRLEFSTGSLAFNRLLLSGATSFSTSMTSTVQTRLALTEALGCIHITLVANTHGSVAAALT
jgi:hypothetical protein